ncbi:MAG: Shikimate kinase [Verrucomicrobia subdivision 3 bacterium]|nr:Shikimate kinase [Limisphaerales bacterium]MCS1414554.1 Shikimate kinase [Limisphaerales bacterium]
MGVGKSTLGRYLAKTLGYQFVDTDKLIEQREGRKIMEIFDSDGEPHFRALEHNLTQEIIEWKRTVISTGGGLITQNDNLKILKRSSFVVCLWASPETIYQRVKCQQHRPLLQTNNLQERICELLKKRSPFYKQSDLIINTDNRPLRVVAQLMIRQYHQAQSKNPKPLH